MDIIFMQNQNIIWKLYLKIMIQIEIVNNEQTVMKYFHW